MVYDKNFIDRNLEIEFVGFNIENGSIIAKKVYQKQKNETSEIDIEFIKQLLLSAKGLRLFSVEKASEENGIIKYDFQVEHLIDWIKAKWFLVKNYSYCKKSLISAVEHIPWVKTMFTTIGIRFSHGKIKDVQLYYHPKPKKSIRLSSRFFRMLPERSMQECQKLKKLIFSCAAWIRLVAIDFKKTSQNFKIYFETCDPTAYEKVKEYFRGTPNFSPFCEIMEYSECLDISFVGIAIVMDIHFEKIRYNIYFVPNF